MTGPTPPHSRRRRAVPAGRAGAGRRSGTLLTACTRLSACALLSVCTLMSACTTGPDATAPGSTVTVGTVTRTSGPTATVTRTAEPSTTRPSATPVSSVSSVSSTGSRAGDSSAPASGGTARPPAATPLPEARQASCPYLPDDQLILLTGQRNGPTTVIDTAPQPLCVFQRSDGGWMAAIRIFRAPDAAGAAAVVDAHIPVADSSPADQPAGWTGGYLTLPDGTPDYPESRTVYGVSKGDTAVIVWTNQEQTVKSRQVVIATIENLGL